MASEMGRLVREAKLQFQEGELKGSSEIYGHEILDITASMMDLLDKTDLDTFSDGYALSHTTVDLAESFLTYSRPWEQMEQQDKDMGFTGLLDMTESAGISLAVLRQDEIPCNSEEDCSSQIRVESASGLISSSSGFVRNAEINFPPYSKKVEGRDSFITLPKSGTSDKLAFTASSVDISVVARLVNNVLTYVMKVLKVIN